MKRTNKYTEKRRKGITSVYGQWKYPGLVTTIPSNDITMKGVGYPVLGISDKGDAKMMLPGMDYKFDGKEVTEYPMDKYETGMELHNPLKDMTIISRYSNLYPRVFRGGETRKSPHYGIDLRAPSGTELYSAGDGVVRKIVSEPTGNNEAGKYIVVESPDHTLHTYMHLSGITDNLAVGQNIKAGDIIGYTGRSGYKDNSFSPHLHYQVQLLPEGKTYDDYPKGIADEELKKRTIDPSFYDWSQYTGHGLPPAVDAGIYNIDYSQIGPEYAPRRIPIDTTYYNRKEDVQSVDNANTNYQIPAKLMFPPLFKQQNGGVKKYLEGNYVDWPFMQKQTIGEYNQPDFNLPELIGSGIGALSAIGASILSKKMSNTAENENTDKPIASNIMKPVTFNATGPISVTPWNYMNMSHQFDNIKNYDFSKNLNPFKLQIGKYLAGNYVNNVMSQWNNMLANSIAKGDSVANMVGSGINAASSIAGNILGQWGKDKGLQDWMEASKEQQGNSTGTMAEIERGEIISTPNGMSIANPFAKYHELYTNQNENNGTVVRLSNDVNYDVAKNKSLSKLSKRVNKYTSMRRQGRSFIFPSTVGIGGLLEPKKGVEYPLAENINDKKQTGNIQRPDYVAMANIVNNRNKDKNFVQRAINPGAYPYLTDDNGNRMTHLMAWGTDENGLPVVYPTIVQKENGLKMLDDDAAWDYAVRNNEFIPLLNSDFADWYSKNGLIKHYDTGGSIHIKPNKRGTFTAAATKHGMGVQEFARKVLANKDNYSSAMVKKANFARNSSHWKH